MTTESWHAEFDPSKFLHRVNLEQLIERNEIRNDNATNNSKSPCILCNNTHLRGIILNDKSFLCQQCYREVSLISYPEEYEVRRRQFAMATEARRLAWEAFRGKFEVSSQESILVFLGWFSLLLVFVSLEFLVLSGSLLAVGYWRSANNKKKTEEWLKQKIRWEQSNPAPTQPIFKHFHDPTAVLTQRDRQILRIFNHWPGYPPFWKYLRSVVISRDGNRCQVTGCPSRAELHVHHMKSVAEGGTHTPSNLLTLCSFHHALEPEKGHERIWGDIKTRHFTLVCAHQRSNRADGGIHHVRAHLRRLELITVDELRELVKVYGFCCPSCGERKIKFQFFMGKNIIRVECSQCQKAIEGPQQLAEETGPLLAEILGVSQNQGRWKARWDMLAERSSATWGKWSGSSAATKRKRKKEQVKIAESTPSCPKCGSPMIVVKPYAKAKWKAFLGCSQYSTTGCTGSAKYVRKSR